MRFSAHFCAIVCWLWPKVPPLATEVLTLVVIIHLYNLPIKKPGFGFMLVFLHLAAKLAMQLHILALARVVSRGALVPPLSREADYG